MTRLLPSILFGLLIASCSVGGSEGEMLATPEGSSTPPGAAVTIAPLAATAPRATATPGSSTPVTSPSPCPAEMVHIGTFCIDRYEAHLRSVASDAIGEIHPHNLRPDEGASYVAVSAPGVYPQGYISRVEAEAACRQADKRLCSRGEWMIACRGTPATPRAADGARACNHGKPHLLTRLFGGGYDYEEHFNSPALNVTPGFLAKTGAHQGCRSTAGAQDMVGNLHEWVSDSVTSSFLRALASDGVSRQFQYEAVGNGVFMGGFYSTRAELGPGCTFTTVAHDPAYHDYATGFRCCREASQARRDDAHSPTPLHTAPPQDSSPLAVH